MSDPTWISVLPPILAIGLAIWTRQVYLSLAGGLWLAWTILEGWNPLAGLAQTIEGTVAVFGDAGDARVIMFTLVIGALIATVVVLLMPGKDGACAVVSRKTAIGAAGGGAALVGLSSATLSWVVCCAAPTWVVSLAMLGMGVSLAFWLEPLGNVITLSGFALLVAAVVVLAVRRIPTRPANSTDVSVSDRGMPAVSS